MVRKKTLEIIQEIQLPKSLIINGSNISPELSKILEDRGCEVTNMASYSPANEKYDYVFLFDNPEISDEIYKKNLKTNGKFLLVLTDFNLKKETVSSPLYKILKIGDISAWNKDALVEKILRFMFSAESSSVVDIAPRHKSADQTDSNMIRHDRIKQDKPSKPTISSQPVRITVEKKQRFHPRKLFFLLSIFLVFFCASLAAGFYWYISSMQKKFTNLEYHVKSNNLKEIAADLKILEGDLKFTKNIYSVIPYSEDVGVLLNTAEEIMAKSQDFISFVLEIIPSDAGIVSITQNISSETLDQFQIKLANLASVLITGQGKIDKINLPLLPKEKIKVGLRSITAKLTPVYDVLPGVKEVFFQPDPKIYLVLFQNNMELRPTGGFIGSYGLLTIANGKIVDFKIEDIYTADGQLKGHIDPPVPIRKYLGQPHFFLRDSNFDPDFAASGMQAAWFLQKELGKNVDGVIAVNLSLAQKLMQAVGSIRLSDFKDEEITADNFFYKIHLLSNNDFFPGSTQKKDVLTAVANELVAKINKSEGITAVNILPILKQAFEGKNIMIYLDNDRMQKIVEDRGWAGRMTKVSCVDRKNSDNQQIDLSSVSCLPDYLSIIEANLGVNKANYAVDKSTVVEKKIDSAGEITTSVTISYLNSENTLLGQSATYVNYLRFFVPQGSQLINLTLNNAPLNPADIDTEKYGDDKTVFGLLVKIAPGNRGVVKINYTLPRLLSTNVQNYQFLYQKQAGDKNSPFVLSIGSPQEISLTPQNFSSSSSRPGEIYYTTDTSVDRVFAMKKD